MQVDLFIPCFIDQMHPDVGFNMVKILEKVGCEVHYNPKQTCCGQPAFNTGFWGEAKEVGKKFIHEFTEDRYIVSPSGSCTGYVRNSHGELFDNTESHNQAKQVRKNLFELTEFLVDVMKIEDVGASFDGKVTYHDACGALRECGIKENPRKLLGNVRGLELVEMAESETCCGFGGTFSVKYESISVGMGEQKVENAVATEAEYLVSTDMSCLMHLDGYINKQGSPIQVKHIADILASGL
jgi:L-lactate dehydrogenase complex protein LldE